MPKTPLKNWFNNLKIATKLWLSFTLVFGVVVVLGLLAAGVVGRLQGLLDHVAMVAEPMSAAAYEMEINAIGSGMGVLSYLHRPDPAFAERFREDQNEFQDFQRAYDAVAPDETARSIGRRAGVTYERFKTLGAELITAKDREVDAWLRFAAAASEINKLLNQGTPLQARANSRFGENLISLRSHWADIALLLSPQGKDEGAAATRLATNAIETRAIWRALAAEASDPIARDWTDRLTRLLDEAFSLAGDILATRQLIDQKVPNFTALRDLLDEILDEEVQILAQEELRNTQSQAQKMSQALRIWLLSAALFILLLAGLSVLIMIKGFVKPIQVLAQGTQALGSGNLSHRIPISTKDEIGQLATAFNHMAAQLQNSAEILETEVARRTEDLSEAKQALENELARRRALEQQLLQAQKMESLGTLTGGIAHDFNNMLYVILGSTELAQKSLLNDSPAQAHLARALEAGQRSKSLVRKILSFSRRNAPDLKPVAVERLLEDSLALLRASLLPTIGLQTEIAHNCGTIMADAAQIEQVIVNLGINAIQAMPNGTGKITVSAQPISIDATAAASHVGLRPGEHVVIKVIDTGAGIPPQILQRVLDPFFTTKPVGQGTGLGLSVAHGVVTAHGGTIQVSSTPGQGTQLTVHLPLCESPVIDQTA